MEATKIPQFVGRATLYFFHYIGGMGYLILDALVWGLWAPFQKKYQKVKILRPEELFFQMVRIGYRSVSIIVIVHVFLGLVLALQMAYILRQFGVQEYIASIVSVAMFRELGPLVTAIVMSGFAGASIAAEIGTMVVSEEIMALKTSGINPSRFLVLPRMLAAFIMIPCLTVLASVIGVMGGAIVGVGLLGIDWALYLDKTTTYLVPKDLITGLIKSFVFAIIIVGLACYEGFKVRGGAEGVGRATTSTVVYSIIAIIGMDVIFTAIFFYIS